MLSIQMEMSRRKFYRRRKAIEETELHSRQTVDLDSQKKEKIRYPRCGLGACLRCGRASKIQRLQRRRDNLISLSRKAITFWRTPFLPNCRFR